MKLTNLDTRFCHLVLMRMSNTSPLFGGSNHSSILFFFLKGSEAIRLRAFCLFEHFDIIIMVKDFSL